MASRILDENAGVTRVSYELPNKHYIAVDMGYIGIDNTTPYVTELDIMRMIWNDFFLLMMGTILLFFDVQVESGGVLSDCRTEVSESDCVCREGWMN